MGQPQGRWKYLTLFLVSVVAIITLLCVLALATGRAEQEGFIYITNAATIRAITGEGDDYATLVWGDPWDMSEPLDVRQLDSPRCVYPNHFDPYTPCPDGIWCGKVRSDVSNPDFFLLHPGYEGTLPVGRIGQLRPIDANHYTQLTFRMYIDAVDPNDPGWQVIWTDGTAASIGVPEHFGESHLFRTYPGWNIYTIDLSLYKTGTPSYAKGKLPWSGKLTGLRLDPGLRNMNNRIVMLDWVRLTPPQTLPIEWVTNKTGNITIGLRTSDSQAEDVLRLYQISGDNTAPLLIPASQGQYNIPVSLPPGDWYVTLAVDDVKSAPAGPRRIKAAPIIRILAPSRTSGQDYATTELKDPWDMNNPEDIYSWGNITPPVFSNGIMSARSIDTNPLNTCSGYWEDPYINLLDDNYWDSPYTTDPPVDTSKYRYFSFRLKVDATPDVSYGGIARVIWSDFLFTNCGATNDIPLHEGWNEVTVDLWAQDILDDKDLCQSPWRASPQRRQVRLDPFEYPEETSFQMDWIKLTALDEANNFFYIRWEVIDLDSSDAITLQISYGTQSCDAMGALSDDKIMPIATIMVLPDGQTIYPFRPSQTITNLPSNSSYTNTVYIPLIMKDYTPCEKNCSRWDTSGVPEGTYYIYIDADDGHNKTRWCSESPVVIKH
jgi:hypothetical protein